MQAQVSGGYNLLIAGIILVAMGLILDYIRTDKWFKVLVYVGVALAIIWAAFLLVGYLPPL